MSDNPALRAATDAIWMSAEWGRPVPWDPKWAFGRYSSKLAGAKGITAIVLSAVASSPDVRKAVIDVLYEVGAGEHLHAQQRASYRRDVADVVLRVLSTGTPGALGNTPDSQHTLDDGGDRG